MREHVQQIQTTANPAHNMFDKITQRERTYNWEIKRRATGQLFLLGSHPNDMASHPKAVIVKDGGWCAAESNIATGIVLVLCKTTPTRRRRRRCYGGKRQRQAPQRHV